MPGVVPANWNQPHPYSHHSSLRHPAPPLTIFCDFDGPILDVSDRYYHTYQLALGDVQAAYQAEGISLPIHYLSKEQFWHMKQERVPDLEIALRSGLRQSQIDCFLQRVYQIVNQPALLHDDQLQPGVRWALALLHAQGVRLVLVTLRCQEQAIQILHNYGLLQLFTTVRGTQECDAAYGNSIQQKSQLLANVLREPCFRDVHASSAWMIGDTEADIVAGQAAGIPTIALTCGIRSKTCLETFEPTRVHSDLLAATHYLVSRMVSYTISQEEFNLMR